MQNVTTEQSSIMNFTIKHKVNITVICKYTNLCFRLNIYCKAYVMWLLLIIFFYQIDTLIKEKICIKCVITIHDTIAAVVKFNMDYFSFWWRDNKLFQIIFPFFGVLTILVEHNAPMNCSVQQFRFPFINHQPVFKKKKKLWCTFKLFSLALF